MEIQKNEDQPNDNKNNSNNNIEELNRNNIDENEQRKENNENNINSIEKSNKNKDINIIININKVEQPNDNTINNNKNINKNNNISEIKVEKEITINKEENINNNENKKENENQESKLDMIIKSLKEKDEIIKSLQNSINNLSSQIKEIKESNEQMKQNYEKQINELKEGIKYCMKKRELEYIGGNLDVLNDKYNNFERVIESKMGFMESNMTKIFEKGEELKKLEENKIIINNENKINNIDKNNVKNNNDGNIKDKNIEKKGSAKQKSLKDQFNMKIYKNFNKILNEIFSDKNLKNEEIDNKSFEKFVKESKDLIQKKESPIEFCTEYINEIKQKIPPELIINVEKKKIKLYQKLNEINDKIPLKMNIKNIDVNDFNIDEFRKEFQLSEEEFPDEVIKKAYITCKGDFNKMLLKLIK